ncbi:hypothetical protein A9P82_06470 [Arachidicoccus ginsenosidimutans]|uniref:helix-turn-helix domain-containing protein n=1 Tax=Arachidicoccus sp. BS20 TaxID=1850526 RepID=UPI0007F14D84|nr:helix-turn-helix transcriptional regulator [Arachidicoccus sp. BS20]ANI88969.1 hypothetical protein A9P82_06470 [Arachidicoccus sp. BS20]
MKVGESIREIREVEKSFKRTYVAQKLGISTRAYANIENNIANITLNRLEKIAVILECTPQYILNYKKIKDSYLHNIHNNGNANPDTGQTNRVQTEHSKTEELYKELLTIERKRIRLLEALLKSYNIDF